MEARSSRRSGIDRQGPRPLAFAPVKTLTLWSCLALAGAAGTLLRFAIGGGIGRAGGPSFPWGTFAVNVTGCLAIGALAGAMDRGALASPLLRVTLTVGLLGGFTTYSSFGLETFRLLATGHWASAALYVVLTNALGLAAVWAGYRALMAI